MTEEIKVKKIEAVSVDLLRARCGVRYWDDATVNGAEDEDGTKIPLRDGDYWCPTIEISTGQILDWPAGTTAKIHYKVCDDGSYQLVGDDGSVVVEIDGYVPKIMCPGGSGYGDYVIMNIGPNGVIEDWNGGLTEFEATQ